MSTADEPCDPMNPVDIVSRAKKAHGGDSEAVIQDNIIKELRHREWLVYVMTASQAMYGWPDLWAAHRLHGQRWIEVKDPVQFSFTPAQRVKFKEMDTKNVGVWVLTGSTDIELARLFQPANWWTYLSIFDVKGGIPPSLFNMRRRK